MTITNKSKKELNYILIENNIITKLRNKLKTKNRKIKVITKAKTTFIKYKNKTIITIFKNNIIVRMKYFALIKDIIENDKNIWYVHLNYNNKN